MKVYISVVVKRITASLRAETCIVLSRWLTMNITYLPYDVENALFELLFVPDFFKTDSSTKLKPSKDRSREPK